MGGEITPNGSSDSSTVNRDMVGMVEQVTAKTGSMLRLVLVRCEVPRRV